VRELRSNPCWSLSTAARPRPGAYLESTLAFCSRQRRPIVRKTGIYKELRGAGKQAAFSVDCHLQHRVIHLESSCLPARRKGDLTGPARLRSVRLPFLTEERRSYRCLYRAQSSHLNLDLVRHRPELRVASDHVALCFPSWAQRMRRHPPKVKETLYSSPLKPFRLPLFRLRSLLANRDAAGPAPAPGYPQSEPSWHTRCAHLQQFA